jgi:DNA-binding MarR family transcriptional regulator
MIDAKRRVELDAAIELIHFSYRELVVHPDRVLAARGLARAHHRVLYFVAKLGAPAVSELLRALGVSKQALAGPLRDLAAQALVRFERGAADARVKHVVLTEAGCRLEARLAARQRQAFAQAFAAAGAQAEGGWRAVMAVLAADAMRRAGIDFPVPPLPPGRPPGGGTAAG